MPDPQPAINAPQTRAAIFLVLALRPGATDAQVVRSACGDIDKLVRAVAARDSNANLSCVLGIGSAAWDQLFGGPRPAGLHAFRELRGGPRLAPSTPGDLLFHIRAERFDMCYELGAQVMARLVGNVDVVDETHGFRYFDDRDLTGFVDGTENPTGPASIASTIVGNEDSGFAGGSYVMVQTNEVKILRHNMPFGRVTSGDSGTYFIGYACSLDPLETMLRNMVIGRPPGTYDRLLDYTVPVTGTNFFAPSLQFLATLASDEPVRPMPPASAMAKTRAHLDR